MPPAGDRGRKRLSPSPPSEPCVRFSRTRLSSRWFPHRDWLADTLKQRVTNHMCREEALAICLLNAVSGAANMRSFPSGASIHVQSRAVDLCALSNPYGYYRRYTLLSLWF